MKPMHNVLLGTGIIITKQQHRYGDKTATPINLWLLFWTNWATWQNLKASKIAVSHMSIPSITKMS